jgi:hypothetical protein
MCISNQINVWRNLKLTWNHKTHYNSNLGKIITCLPIYIYIYIWYRSLWNYIKMTKVSKFWNWTFWFCHIVIFATLKNSWFFHMISKLDNITYNPWKRLFNVTSIFLIKFNWISQISITSNLIMYQQRKSTY